MSDAPYICLACRARLPAAEEGVYANCRSCGSSRYCSIRSAEDDNRAYFNGHREAKPLLVRAFTFALLNRLDALANRSVHLRFGGVLRRMEGLIAASTLSVEIGFGSGDELVRRLRAGANCYGYDLSSESVDRFKRRYPEYADRVACQPAGTSTRRASSIYSNALFEHLDTPDEFLQGANRELESGGYLLLRIPAKTDLLGADGSCDINFWKPCHRMLYSLDGLHQILVRNGFQVMSLASLPYYGYRVMNELLRRGCSAVHEVRSPYHEIAGLGFGAYLAALAAGFRQRLICSELAVIARKVLA